MIKNKISMAFLSIIMDKRARKKLNATSKNFDESNYATNENGYSNHKKSRDKNKANILPKEEKIGARSELIKRAMAIYRSKKYIVDALPKEQKEKLMFMALKIFGENKSNSKSD